MLVDVKSSIKERIVIYCNYKPTGPRHKFLAAFVYYKFDFTTCIE